VATADPRKNLPLLVAAYGDARAAGTVPGHELVVVGPPGVAPADGDAPGVRPLGYVDADDLPALYAESAALVFPSRYEGFGMPALEARACGARVIATDLPELREAGGPGATYVAATRPAVAHALGAVWRTPATPPEPGCHDGWDGAARTLAAALTAAAAQVR
jgi:glycosyltransferase involved in cell wall biosynthesis